MATHFFLSPTTFSSPKTELVKQKSVHFATIRSEDSITPIAKSHDSISPSFRRLADYSYKPSIWDYNYLQSLKSYFKMVDKHKRRAEKLKADVKLIFENFAQTDVQLVHFELIEDLQRLGLAYHFEQEIKSLLEYIYISRNKKGPDNDLYATALEFRLFRQHGYYISQDVFKRFVDDKGSFKDTLRKDAKGISGLYEASYLSFVGDNLMNEAWYFTSEAQKDWSEKVKTFELPLHWMSPRLEVRRFINIYEKRVGMNPLLLELAKLDFNLLQGLHMEELQNQSRWWNNIGLAEKMGFARDRLVECFLWGVGISFEPQFELRRTFLTRTIALVTVIDDIYDVYGTLDELELFTDAVERWNINIVNQLPNYMKICFVALYNFVNEIVYDILKNQDLEVLPYLKKAWVDLVKSYLVEARWYHNGIKPTFDEYMKNGCVSIATPLCVLKAYVGTREPIKVEALEFLAGEPDIVYWAGFIFRLSDDCGTSSDELKRGDVPKSIQCYMNEAGVCEEIARKHMKDLMRMAWEKVNQISFAAETPLSRTFIESILNLVRSSHCFYHNGDGHGIQDDKSIDRVTALFLQPIHL